MSEIKLVGHKAPYPVSKIMYVVGDGNYSMLHTDEGKTLLLPMTLKVIQWQTPQLVRIHKGYLINPAFVERYVNKRPHMVAMMTDGNELSISRMGVKALRAMRADHIK